MTVRTCAQVPAEDVLEITGATRSTRQIATGGILTVILTVILIA